MLSQGEIDNDLFNTYVTLTRMNTKLDFFIEIIPTFKEENNERKSALVINR